MASRQSAFNRVVSSCLIKDFYSKNSCPCYSVASRQSGFNHVVSSCLIKDFYRKTSCPCYSVASRQSAFFHVVCSCLIKDFYIKTSCACWLKCLQTDLLYWLVELKNLLIINNIVDHLHCTAFRRNNILMKSHWASRSILV